MATNDDLLMFSAREAKAMLDGGVASIAGNEFNGVTVARLAMAVVHYAEALNGVSRRGKRAAALVTTMEDRAESAERECAALREQNDDLRKLGAQVADQHKAFLTLAATETPGLARLARAALDGESTTEESPFLKTAEHWAALAMARDFLRSLGEAPNYLTMTMATSEGDIEVTVRRAEGKTPAAVIGELKARIADLERLATGPRTAEPVDDGLARPFAPETLPGWDADGREVGR